MNFFKNLSYFTNIKFFLSDLLVIVSFPLSSAYFNADAFEISHSFAALVILRNICEKPSSSLTSMLLCGLWVEQKPSRSFNSFFGILA